MAWDKTKPANDELLVDTPAQLRANWEALELLTDAALQITNAKVAAAAGIVDTKLATISTANKVLGSAIGSLPSIPAGAGKVPVANIDTGTTANKIVILDGSGFLPAVSGTNLTNIPTSAIASGTMASARLGSGTAAATTFLTGAGVWATVPSAGGWRTHTKVTSLIGSHAFSITSDSVYRLTYSFSFASTNPSPSMFPCLFLNGTHNVANYVIWGENYNAMTTGPDYYTEYSGISQVVLHGSGWLAGESFTGDCLISTLKFATFRGKTVSGRWGNQDYYYCREYNAATIRSYPWTSLSFSFGSSVALNATLLATGYILLEEMV